MSANFPARLARFALIAGTSFVLGLPQLAAQSDDGEVDAISQPVVQPLPGGPGMKLDSALGKLARNPRDVNALIEAGQASAAIGDAEAAMGFFRRADQLQPANANIKAGLAGAMVLAEDPFSALPLFWPMTWLAITNWPSASTARPLRLARTMRPCAAWP